MEKSTLYPAEAGFIPSQQVRIGGVVFGQGELHYNQERPTLRIRVQNTGDRPIQVGSHFHFFEVNRLLQFDREAAFGCHLNIPATTAIRFEPGDEREVELVPFAGKQRITGFNGLVGGYAGCEPKPDYYPARARALRRMLSRGFRDCKAANSSTKNEQK